MVRQPATIIADAIRHNRYLGETTIDFNELLRAFIIAGYGEEKARKWIRTYSDYGLLKIDRVHGIIDISSYPKVIRWGSFANSA